MTSPLVIWKNCKRPGGPGRSEESQSDPKSSEVFGFFGKVMDTRRIALTTEHVYEDRDAAEQASAQIARQHSVDTRVIPVLKERPHGTIVLTDGRTTIQSNDAIWFEPVRNDGSILVRRVEHGRGFRWHGHEDRRYRGILYVTVDRAGKLAIGNMLNSETLLRGLVPTEIFPSAPQAALRAQAVAARGELLAKLGHRHLADPYQICSDVHCQAYTGTRREDPRTDRAIEATSGRMLFHNHQLVDTVYSASCGGHTEHNDLVWGTTPDETLRGRPDGNVSLGEPTEDAVRAWVTGRPASYCGTTSYGASSFRWVDQVQSSEVRQSLQGQGIELGPIQAMRVLQRGVSGRAISLEISDRSGRSTTVNGELRIRRLLGGLKSALFVIEADTSEGSPPRSFRFIGGGFGHGVGMCQTGAIGMAEASKSFDEILRAYYLDSSIERIY